MVETVVVINVSPDLWRKKTGGVRRVLGARVAIEPGEIGKAEGLGLLWRWRLAYLSNCGRGGSARSWGKQGRGIGTGTCRDRCWFRRTCGVMCFGRRQNFLLEVGDAFCELLDLLEQQSFSFGQSRSGTVRLAQ